MINGDSAPLGTSTDRDPFGLSAGKLEGGGGSTGSLSDYSSCGESEFDRYCSANSVMGTPSVCSSFAPANEFLDSEFGSSRSLDDFSLGGRIDRDLEGRKLSKLSNSGVDCLNGEVDGVDVSSRVISRDAGRIIGDSSGMAGWLDAVQEGNVTGSNDGLGKMSLGEVAVEENDGFPRRLASEMVSHHNAEQVGMEVEEDGLSCTNGHSEDDDDSMYGCGSDDENRKNLYIQGKIQYSKNVTIENNNPLRINSSVAFGSDDFDDFEQETIGGNLTSLTLDEFQELGTQKTVFNSMPIIVEPVAGPTKMGGHVTEALPRSRLVADFGADETSGGCPLGPTCSQNSEMDQLEGVRDIPVASCQLREADGLSKVHRSTSSLGSDLSSLCGLDQEDASDNCLSYNNSGSNVTMELFKNSSISDILDLELDPLDRKDSVGLKPLSLSSDKQMEPQGTGSEDIGFILSHQALEKQAAKSVEVKVDPPLTHHSGTVFFEDHEWTSAHSALQDDFGEISGVASALTVTSENHQMTKELGNVELNEFYDEVVNEMEEILLDSNESTRPEFLRGNLSFHSHPTLPQRDGGRTASTSAAVDTYSLTKQLKKIDGADVVGAKQKRGDVSLSERLVGVKEYTVYTIRVCSGKDQWEVERRYRDFLSLHRQLKSLSAYQGWSLPLPWSSVGRESKNLLGSASPDVVSERSVLIQECLHSVLVPGLFSSLPSALCWFLCPHDSLPSSPVSETQSAGSRSFGTYGKTIHLIVEIRPYKSMKQLLEAQRDTCAGCYKHFGASNTLIHDFAKTLGWGKPRLCEYTGQLFCSSCHTNDAAVLPARVLHYWDFTKYPVSQMAKSYLDSIHEQPMLCVSAVNPFLSSKVPVMHHVMSVRKRLGSMLPYLRCPFRRTLNKGLGSRRYLLETTDFFALRDLIDLSKGAFAGCLSVYLLPSLSSLDAALPVMVETVSAKIREHITEQCLVCCDVGIPCGARQACDDTSSLIFPFQESEIERCSSCNLVLHRSCFRKLPTCSCGARLGGSDIATSTNRSNQLVHNESLGRSTSFSTARLLSGLFSKGKEHKANDSKDGNTVILMGSLPTTTLRNDP
ncbi:Pleckstrin homology domain-containing family M member 3 [Linum perenne]